MVAFIRDQLRCHFRTGKGRCPFPVTLIVDSQSVKAASTVGRGSRGRPVRRGDVLARVEAR
ncbi:hypothetical protein AB0L61_39595, partial [Streptomyces tendae]